MLRIVYTEAKVITGKRQNSTYHYKGIVYINSTVLTYVANLQRNVHVALFVEINIEHNLFPFGVQ